MNTFWLKVAAVVIIIVAAVIVVSKFRGGSHAVVSVEPEQPAKPKTFYDVIAQDDKRLRAPVEANQAVQQQFKQLAEEQKVDAEQLYEMAIAQRKMGRLPGMSYGQMVEYCRMIIERYPESEYAYKARKMLGEVPQREWERHKITQDEIDGKVIVPSK